MRASLWLLLLLVESTPSRNAGAHETDRPSSSNTCASMWRSSWSRTMRLIASAIARIAASSGCAALPKTARSGEERRARCRSRGEVGVSTSRAPKLAVTRPPRAVEAKVRAQLAGLKYPRAPWGRAVIELEMGAVPDKAGGFASRGAADEARVLQASSLPAGNGGLRGVLPKLHVTARRGHHRPRLDVSAQYDNRESRCWRTQHP